MFATKGRHAWVINALRLTRPDIVDLFALGVPGTGGGFCPPPAGAFPKSPPGAGLGKEAAQNQRFPVRTPPPKKPETRFTALE